MKDAVRREGSQTAYEAAYEGRILALLPEEPAGRISTRNAGAISFRAALTRRLDEEKRIGFTLGDPPPDTRFYSLVQTGDAASAVQEICCEIRALHIEQLTGALDAVLRSVTAYAALNEAVLETHVVRLADPSVTPTALAERLARQLSRAGLCASFGSSWTPAPFADASVGTQGLQEDFRSFLRTHPEWQPPC